MKLWPLILSQKRSASRHRGNLRRQIFILSIKNVGNKEIHTWHEEVEQSCHPLAIIVRCHGPGEDPVRMKRAGNGSEQYYEKAKTEYTLSPLHEPSTSRIDKILCLVYEEAGNEPYKSAGY